MQYTIVWAIADVIKCTTNKEIRLFDKWEVSDFIGSWAALIIDSCQHINQPIQSKT